MNISRVAIASAVGQEEPCEIEFTRGVPTELTATSQHFGTMSFVDDNLFSALLKLRLRLEQDGYLLLCNAARKDAYPSRMTLEMGGGRKIYLLNSGVQTTREDLVDVLGAASVDQVCTVAEQRIGYEDWLRSLK
jgi:hypothetical protein